jgi:hypothetical protein
MSVSIIPQSTPNGTIEHAEPEQQLAEIDRLLAMATVTPLAAQDNGAAPAPHKPSVQQNIFDTWQVVSAAEYANRPLPERRWMIDGLLSFQSVTVFHGMPGSLKTQLALDAAACVACGEPWLPQLDGGGGYTYSTVKTPVVWLNFDMSEEDIHERAAAVYRTHSGLSEATFDVVSLQTPWLNLAKQEYAADLAEWISKRGYGLAVIDNFSSVKGQAKLVDESIADVMLNIRRITALAGCAIWVIHHETKNVAGKTPYERMYGGIHIASNVEAAFSVTRDDEFVTLTASKQRGFMVRTEFSAMHAYTHLQGGVLETFRFLAADRPIVQQEMEERAPAQYKIMRHMLQSPMLWQTAEQIHAAIDDGTMTVESVRKALERLCTQRDKAPVERQGGGRKGAPSMYRPCLQEDEE